MMSNIDNRKILCSFIIPHLGRENMLIDTLESISLLESGSFAIEVIVVTKNETLLFDAAKLSKKMSILVKHAAIDVTISTQRNMGFEASKGDLIAFLDADIYLANNWLIELSKLLDNSKKVISAIQKDSENAPPLEVLKTQLCNANSDSNVDFLPGSNLLMARDTFIISGGFPEHLVTCEDYVFTQKVSEQGFLYLTSESSYIHLGEDKEYLKMAKKEIWRGQSNLSSLKGRKISLSEYPSFIAPSVFTIGLILAVLCVALTFYSATFISAFMSFFILGIYTLRLRKISTPKLPYINIIKFYSLYFPARTWGTILGLMKSVRVGSHSK
jgi:glycosyltransferase involved in cell wall biosynthesis